MKVRAFLSLQLGNVFISHLNNPVISIASNTHVFDAGNVDCVLDMIQIMLEGSFADIRYKWPDLANANDAAAIGQKFQVFIRCVANVFENSYRLYEK